MRPHDCHCLVVGLFLMSLALATPHPASATIVFDDHFDGNSGGMPAGWYLLSGPGTAVESGTTVTLYGDVVIASYATVDPSQGTVTLTAEIAGYPDAEDVLAVAFASPSMGAVFGFDFWRPSGQISVGGYQSPGDWQIYVAGYLGGYQGGAIKLTLELGPAEFTIAADSPPFLVGPIAYTDAFPTLTREDLGSEAMLFIQNDVPEPGSNWCSIDRLTVDAEGGSPVQSMTFGQIKALFRR